MYARIINNTIVMQNTYTNHLNPAISLSKRFNIIFYSTGCIIVFFSFYVNYGKIHTFLLKEKKG